ncbi:alpha-amylase family protein [Erythrobacter sp. F6033]|uniref:alpha-amylase family protein n=1 Tax=Erythrobacter sp. F6033 TaxID=2926401 RepID=UPI001FF359C9|nr:alpha-amylase family protein [Erythrobacter sp. F6033]MCK0129296.1 beta-galactosidase [Erythrobacter sp. F6033]
MPSQVASASTETVAASDMSESEAKARAKIATLEGLMEDAQARGIDVKREETLVWFSKEFLKFANWDEENRDQIEAAFGYYKKDFVARKKYYADILPEFERTEVGKMLDTGIAELKDVLAGKIDRPAANPVDWKNITVGDNALYSAGRPVFLYDYFSKTVGAPLTDTRVYNDHLGAIFHGGENLYPVNHDRAINTYLLREDGTYDPELLREVTDIDPSNVGFLYFWNMGYPDWMAEKEPQIGMSRSLFTGFDIDNPLIRKSWGKIARDMGELTKGKKVTQLGFVLSNEPHYFAEKNHWTARFGEMQQISDHTFNFFRQWLTEKYDGDIAALNANWGSSFTNFDSVELEVPMAKNLLGTPKWYDFMRFNMDRTTNWFEFLQGELHKGNPDADTSIKLMTHLWTHSPRSHGLDFEALTELTTMIGDDARAVGARSVQQPELKTPWEDRYAYDWSDLGMGYDFVESVAPDKIHFNSETHMLSASNWRELDTPPEYVRSTFWLATLQGMDVGTSWFWARDPDGSPEDRLEGELDFFDTALTGSYAASVNMQPRIANEKTQVYLDMNSVAEHIVELREQRRAVRIFYTETSAINKNNHMYAMQSLHEKLFFDGMPVGFATKNILEKQDNSEWDAVLVYRTPYVTDAEFAALQTYLDNGGTVIVDSAKSLALNEYGKARTAKLNAGAGKLIVKGNADSAAMRKAALVEVSELPAVKLSETNPTGQKGVMWRVIPNGKGGHIVNILNLGKDNADITMSLREGGGFTAVNLETGDSVSASTKLPRHGVLLLEVTPAG